MTTPTFSLSPSEVVLIALSMVEEAPARTLAHWAATTESVLPELSAEGLTVGTRGTWRLTTAGEAAVEALWERHWETCPQHATGAAS